MRRIIVCALFWFAITTACVYSAEVSEIYLDDGSILRAEVVSLQDGVYTLRSASMGKFNLDASRVSRINSRQEGQSSDPADLSQAQQQPFGSQENFKAKVDSAQAAIMKDPEAMQSAMAMASDPEFQKLLEDPEAVAALKKGDVATLMKKPQFQAIMNNPKMQGFADKMKDKIQDPQ
jgi:hypothetical protein